MNLLTNRKSWTYEEDQAIKSLVAMHGIEDWTHISNKVKEQFGDCKRSGKQCRERWYNHLSPAINKQPWSLQQQNKLFQLHRQQGNKWKDISKSFIGRTDNDLKNHFYSTLRKSLRRLNKSLGQKNSTSQMREIKPSVLSTIMHYIYSEQNQSVLIDSLKDVPKLIFEFANIKPARNVFSLKDDQIKDKILGIFNLITQFNQQYQKCKSKKKQKVVGRKPKLSASLTNIPKQQNQDNTQKNSYSQEEFIQNQSSTPNSSSILEESYLDIKHEMGGDHTDISLTCSDACYQKPQQNGEADQNDDGYNFMLLPQRSCLLQEDDQIMKIYFQDPEEPSALNDYTFNQGIIGRNIFFKVQQENCCGKIVDEVFEMGN